MVRATPAGPPSAKGASSAARLARGIDVDVRGGAGVRLDQAGGGLRSLAAGLASRLSPLSGRRSVSPAFGQPLKSHRRGCPRPSISPPQMVRLEAPLTPPPSACWSRPRRGPTARTVWSGVLEHGPSKIRRACTPARYGPAALPPFFVLELSRSFKPGPFLRGPLEAA